MVKQKIMELEQFISTLEMMMMSQRKGIVKRFDVSDDGPMVRRLGEEREGVAIIIDSGADVALSPLGMADHWKES